MSLNAANRLAGHMVDAVDGVPGNIVVCLRVGLELAKSTVQRTLGASVHWNNARRGHSGRKCDDEQVVESPFYF